MSVAFTLICRSEYLVFDPLCLGESGHHSGDSTTGLPWVIASTDERPKIMISDNRMAMGNRNDIWM